jgi:hypothetical protein
VSSCINRQSPARTSTFPIPRNPRNFSKEFARRAEQLREQARKADLPKLRENAVSRLARSPFDGSPGHRHPGSHGGPADRRRPGDSVAQLHETGAVCEGQPICGGRARGSLCELSEVVRSFARLVLSSAQQSGVWRLLTALGSSLGPSPRFVLQGLALSA